MFLKEYMKQYKNVKVKLFVDMDGVIADYVFDNAKDYDKKRPLYSSIEKLEKIAKEDNIELFILSVTRMNVGYDEKQNWLDRYAPFFKKENRVIISREKHGFEETATLKANYIKNLERDGSVIVVIDDDPRIIKEIRELNEDVVLLKDTALVD